MEIIAVIMHLVNGSVVEASVSATASRMLCTEVVKNHVVFDVETTGFSPQSHEIMQLAETS